MRDRMLIVRVPETDVQFGAWDQESKTRSSIITKDGVEYQGTAH